MAASQSPPTPKAAAVCLSAGCAASKRHTGTYRAKFKYIRTWSSVGFSSFFCAHMTVKSTVETGEREKCCHTLAYMFQLKYYQCTDLSFQTFLLKLISVLSSSRNWLLCYSFTEFILMQLKKRNNLIVTHLSFPVFG